MAHRSATSRHCGHEEWWPTSPAAAGRCPPVRLLSPSLQLLPDWRCARRRTRACPELGWCPPPRTTDTNNALLASTYFAAHDSDTSSRTGVARIDSQSAAPWREVRRPYVPVQVGSRFCRKALIPSWASQVIAFSAIVCDMRL